MLEKAEKEIVDKNNYIEQLRNYILVDLKQKTIPTFSQGKGSMFTNEGEEESELIKELERQLEMERSMHLVQ